MQSTAEKSAVLTPARVQQTHEPKPFFSIETQAHTGYETTTPLPIIQRAFENSDIEPIQRKKEPTKSLNTEGPPSFIQRAFENESERLPLPAHTQAKLNVSQPDDPHEREADHVADRVMRMSHTDIAVHNADNQVVNRSKEAGYESSSPTIESNGSAAVVDLKPLAADISPIQRHIENDIQCALEQDTIEPVNRAPEIAKTVAPPLSNPNDEGDSKPQSTIQRQSETAAETTSTNHFESQLRSRQGLGSPLPDGIRAFMEPRFGADFSAVRIHTDYTAARLTRQVQAQAFAFGNNIYFNPARYSPHTASGQRLLAHELTHTVQQGGAGVRRKVEVTSVPTMVQRSAWDTALELLGDIADRVPGYRMLSVLFERDLIRNVRVERNATNLVDGIMSLAPFGHDLFLQLRDRGILQRAFELIGERLQAHQLTRQRINRVLQDIQDTISVTDAIHPLEFFNAKVKPIVDDAIAFAGDLVTALITFIKEAAKSFLNEHVNGNAGYRLLTKILHNNPITGDEVRATTEEILADFLRLLGKTAELEEMQKRGTLQRTAAWIDQQLRRFSGLLRTIQDILTQAWEAVQPRNIAHIMDNMRTLAEDIYKTGKDIVDFAVDVATTVLQFIKDALLGFLRDNANNIPGYHLLAVILGKDPFTQTPVARNALNLIRGFMGLIPGGEEKFNQMQETGAIQRMSDWIEGKIQEFGITWDFIQNLFINIWNSFTIQDLIRPLEAFIRIIENFRAPLARVVNFLFQVVKKIVTVILEVMNFPSDIIAQIVERAMQAYEDIKRDPVQFFVNLLNALKQGFSQFFGNIGTHLLSGLANWLFAELESANINPPRELSFRAILGFVLEVLGITLQRIFEKLERRLQRPGLAARLQAMGDRLEGALSFVSDIMRDGPSGVWRHIQERISNLWDTVLEQIKSWLMTRVIEGMVQRLLSMLDPSGIMAVVNSFMAFYRAVQSFIEKLREILQIVNSFVGGIAEIARGSLNTAANFLEGTLARAVPTVIGFLANQLGLRNLGQRIGAMIEIVREKVDLGLDWLVDRAARMGGALLNMGRQAVRAVAGWLGIRKPLFVNGERHTLYFQVHGNNVMLMLASNPTLYQTFISNIPVGNDSAKIIAKQSAMEIAANIDIENLTTIPDNAPNTEQLRQAKQLRISQLLDQLAPHTTLLLNLLTGVSVMNINGTSTSSTPTPGEIRYSSDNYQRPIRASGWLKVSSNRHPSSQIAVSRPVNDYIQKLKGNGINIDVEFAGGHLIGDQYGGSGGVENIVPMEQRMNGSYFVSFEGYIASHVRDSVTNGTMIYANVTVSYSNKPFERLLDDSLLSQSERTEGQDILSRVPDTISFFAGIRHPDGREVDLRPQTFDPRVRFTLTMSEARRRVPRSSILFLPTNRDFFK
jgi:hypothetical protein